MRTRGVKHREPLIDWRANKRETARVETALASCAGRYVIKNITVSNDAPGEVVIWDVNTWRDCLTLTLPLPHEFSGVGFEDNGRTVLATANENIGGLEHTAGGQLVAWDTAKNDSPFSAPSPSAGKAPADPFAGRTLTFSLPPKKDDGKDISFNSISIHRSGEYVQAVVSNGTLVVWNCRSGDTVGKAQLSPSRSWTTAFSPDGDFIYCYDQTHRWKPTLLSFPGLAEVDTPPDVTPELMNTTVEDNLGARHSSKRWSLETPDKDHPARIYAKSLATGELSKEPCAVEVGLQQSVFFPDGEHFATVGDMNQVHLWSVNVPTKVTWEPPALHIQGPIMNPRYLPAK
jgi:hypothetical protein